MTSFFSLKFTSDIKELPEYDFNYNSKLHPSIFQRLSRVAEPEQGSPELPLSQLLQLFRGVPGAFPGQLRPWSRWDVP